jgi:adenine-specific DNA glycosylase
VALWRQAGEPVVHVFTHFRLELEVAWARVPAKDGAKLAPDGVWVAPGALSRYALPTVMKKVCRVGFAALGDELEGRRPAQV